MRYGKSQRVCRGKEYGVPQLFVNPTRFIDSKFVPSIPISIVFVSQGRAAIVRAAFRIVS
jgi:hypothetical protein